MLITLVYLAIQVRLVRDESARADLVDRGLAIREPMVTVVSDEALAGEMRTKRLSTGRYIRLSRAMYAV